MRVLMVTEDYHGSPFGGIPRLLRETCTRLVKLGDEVVVLMPRLPHDLPERESIDGVEVVRYHCSAGGGLARLVSSYRSSKALAEGLQRENAFDVINVHFYLSALGVMDSAAGRKTRTVFTFHGPADAEFVEERTSGPALKSRLEAWLIGRLQRRVLLRSHAYVVLSGFMQGLLGGILPAPKRKLISKIPGGVNADRFAPVVSMADARASLNLPESGPVLLSVRRLIRRNGLDRLILAMPAILDRCPGCVLVVVGRGEIREELEAQVRGLGLGDAVRFEGFVPDEKLPAYYCAADFTVMPTRSLEGFGLPILESMACGTPVIGSRCGAIPETIAGFDPEFLLPENLSPDDIAGTICDLTERYMGKPDLRERCRRYAVENYDWDKFVDSLRRVYAGER